MEGLPINALNAGIQDLRCYLTENVLAARSTEVALIRVGRPFEVVVDFTPADRFIPPLLEAKGDTPLAEGILLGIQLIESRLARLDALALDWFRPWLLVLSDGEPTSSEAIPVAIREIKRVQNNQIISVFAVGINDEAAMKLREFGVQYTETLDHFRFRDLFRWVSTRIIHVSQSIVGEEPDYVDLSDATWRKK
jgi:uncharacterized protein YegL